MPGGQTQTSNQQQSSTTQPWSPAIPALTGILNNAANTNTASNASQNSAIAQLENNASGATNFGQPVANVATSLLNGGNPAYSGILSNSYNNLQSNLNPIANGSALGNNSALNTELGTIANDTQNAVESQFAAAGRGGPGAMSPAEAQAIARGTAQGEAPVMAQQFNTNVANQLAANGELANAGLATGTGLNSMTTGNELSGINAAGTYPGILNANAQSLLQAGNLEQALPFQGLGLAESSILPIAGLGAESSGTSNGTTTMQQPLGPTLLGGILGGSALLGSGGLNVLSPLGSWLTSSDVRAKHHIKKIGILNDNQPIYSFKYHGDPTGKTHIGLLAQNVEQHHPEAVHNINGMKYVDYDKATASAGNMAA